MFKFFSLWREPTPQELITQQLAQTERDLLLAEHAKDHYDSECEKLRTRRDRLQDRLAEATGELSRREVIHERLRKAIMGNSTTRET